MESHSLEEPVSHRRKRLTQSHTYIQCILWHSAFRHVVFSHPGFRGSRSDRPRERFVEKGFALFLRRDVPLKKLEELVTEDELDLFDCLGGIPPICGLEQKGVECGIRKIQRSSSHTSQSSLRSSSLALSIICFNISSWMSHSWNAAVSVLSRTPSKICENLKSLM